MRIRRAGFTLIEMTAVMAVLAVLISLIGATMLMLSRIEQADAAVFQHMLNHGVLADQFRGDVAQAVSALKEWDRFQAGPHCLILAQGKNAWVVYERDQQGLMRWHFQAGAKTSQRLPIGTRTVDFPRGDGRLLTMRLRAGEGPPQRTPLEITAALGGERR